MVNLYLTIMKGYYHKIGIEHYRLIYSNGSPRG